MLIYAVLSPDSLTPYFAPPYREGEDVRRPAFGEPTTAFSCGGERPEFAITCQGDAKVTIRFYWKCPVCDCDAHSCQCPRPLGVSYMSGHTHPRFGIDTALFAINATSSDRLIVGKTQPVRGAE
jgi:hypothetical protein